MPFLLGYAKGIAAEVNTKEDFSHVTVGISHINVKSVGECCCKLCPKPSLNETIFFRAGNEQELDDKTFHYLSGSLFDVPDENVIVSEEKPMNTSEIVVNPDMELPNANKLERENPAADKEQIKNLLDDMINEKKDNFDDYSELNAIPQSRDKFGNVDENYGNKRFGAIFMDSLFSGANLNKSLKSNNQEELETDQSSSQPDIFSLYFIFYGIDINLSANFVHRVFKLYDCSRMHNYTQPYSQLNDHNDGLSGSNFGDEASSKIMIENLAKKFEKYVPLFNQTFVFKDPSIKFHPYSHLLLTSAPVIHFL